MLVNSIKSNNTARISINEKSLHFIVYRMNGGEVPLDKCLFSLIAEIVGKFFTSPASLFLSLSFEVKKKEKKSLPW